MRVLAYIEEVKRKYIVCTLDRCPYENTTADMKCYEATPDGFYMLCGYAKIIEEDQDER